MDFTTIPSRVPMDSPGGVIPVVTQVVVAVEEVAVHQLAVAAKDLDVLAMAIKTIPVVGVVTVVTVQPFLIALKQRVQMVIVSAKTTVCNAIQASNVVECLLVVAVLWQFMPYQPPFPPTPHLLLHPKTHPFKSLEPFPATFQTPFKTRLLPKLLFITLFQHDPNKC